MIYSNSVLIALRRISRRIGLNRQIERFLAVGEYEKRFSSAFLRQLQTGDCVWDIGANVGWYTTQFAKAIGPYGTVVAFEPVPSCFTALKARVEQIPTVHPVNIAMAETDGEITMALASGAMSDTHRVLPSSLQPHGRDTITAMARSAVSVLNLTPQWFPNVIKIDVEGYEGLVVRGMRSLLTDMRLRCIGIEIHFKLLEDQGEKDCPRFITQTLKQNGFNIRWPDPSHLIACRSA